MKRRNGKEKVRYHKGGGKGNTSNNGHSYGDKVVTSKNKGGRRQCGKTKGKKFDKSKVECYGCGKHVHFVDECCSGKGKKVMRHRYNKRKKSLLIK